MFGNSTRTCARARAAVPLARGRVRVRRLDRACTAAALAGACAFIQISKSSGVTLCRWLKLHRTILPVVSYLYSVSWC